MLKLSNYTLVEAGTTNYLYQIDVSNLNIKEMLSIYLVDGTTEMTTNTSKELKDLYEKLNSNLEFSFNLQNDILHLAIPRTINIETAKIALEYYRYPIQVNTLEDTIDIPEEYMPILSDYIIAEASTILGKLIPEYVLNNIRGYENANQ